MSSERKIITNRENAKRSTGPKTEAGKAISSRNNTRHGLAGDRVVIETEDPAKYEALRSDLMLAYKPANTSESILVEEIAQCFWRLQRARDIESETFNLSGGGSDPVLAFGMAAEDLDRVRRYMTTIERAWHRAMQQLERMQALRAKQSPAVERSTESIEDEPISPRAAAPMPSLPYGTPQLFVIPVEHSASTPAGHEQPPGH
jgi:hypothetical protein